MCGTELAYDTVMVETRATGASKGRADTTMPIRTLILDKHTPVRSEVEALLRQAGDIDVVGKAAWSEDLIAKAARLKPDVVIFRVGVLSQDTIDTIQAVRTRSPETSILVLTQESDPTAAMRALEAGAVGYVLEDIEPPNLVRAVRNVAEGKAMLNPRLARHIIHRMTAVTGRATTQELHAKGLSDREIEVLATLAKGFSNRDIARNLSLAEATIKSHLRSIYRKLGFRNRGQAVAFATSRGVMAPSSRSN